MRLLKLDHNDRFELTSFPSNATPPYAIISHTWGRGEDDEVTFKDILDGVGRDKKGYQKLQFCYRQAKEHDLTYFWVDTCCIDKSNSSELTESINSMFRWYKQAERCYAYLADVFLNTSNGQYVEWESAFRNSRWFTRGWTLQELLAPRQVEFYSQEGRRLGDKTSLSTAIQEVTGINAEALCQGTIDSYSIEERLCWIEKRQTTREEDKAYSMLGICNVYMPMIYGEGEESAFRRLRREISGLSEKSQPAAPEVQRHIVMPFERNPRFVGREDELMELQSLLFQDTHTSRAAIVGLGGMGKTQIAVELVHRTLDRYRDCSVFWLVSTDPETLLQSYRAVAEKLSIPGLDVQNADIVRLVQAHLSQGSVDRWLLVFDNADDIDMWTRNPDSAQRPLIDSLPRSTQGAILFTTRNRKIAVKLSHLNVVELGELQHGLSKDLLQKHLSKPELITSADASEALLEALINLPLAIVQATAYINANRVSVIDYLELLKKQDETTIDLLSEDFEDEGRYRSIQNPVATTWLISFERIRKHDPLAADYLSFMACVKPKDVPIALLPHAASEKQHLEALGTLYAYSFVAKRPTSQSLDMHRLVHLAMRNWLSKNDMMRSRVEKTITHLETQFPDSEYVNRPLWRQYLPSVMSALQLPRMSHYEDARMKLAHRVGNCLSEDGRYREAEQLFQIILGEQQENLGADHVHTLVTIDSLLGTYNYQGRWVEAEQLGVQLVETNKRILGDEHPDTLRSMKFLATSYFGQGRFVESENVEIQVLESSSRVLGEEHPGTLTSMANLADTYRNQTRFAEAEQLDVQVLAVRRRVLGEEHPDTLTSMGNLASTYCNQRRFAEAEQLEMQVLAVRRRVLGEEHPDTFATMANLACTYDGQRRFAEAEQLHVQVIAVRRRVLGEEHPDTLTSMANLASTYCDQRRFVEAEQLGVQVLAVRRRLLGEEHPYTLMSMNNLATTLAELGRTSEAMAIMERCAELRARVLGADHPRTLNCVKWLEIWNRSQLEQAEVERSGDEQPGDEQPKNRRAEDEMPYDGHKQSSAIEGRKKKPSRGTGFLKRFSRSGRQ